MKKISLSIYTMAILTFSDAMALESNYFHQLQTKQNQVKVHSESVSQYEADTIDQDKVSDFNLTHLNYDYGYDDQLTLGLGVTMASGQSYRNLKDRSLIQADIDGIKDVHLSVLRTVDLVNAKLFLKGNLHFALDNYRLNIADQSANASTGQHVIGAEVGYLHDLEWLQVGVNFYRSYQLPGKAIFTDLGTSRSIELMGGGQSNLKMIATYNNKYQPTIAVFQNTVFNTIFNSSSQNLKTSSDEYWTRGYEFNAVFQLSDNWSILPAIIKSEQFSMQSTNLIATQFKAELRYLF